MDKLCRSTQFCYLCTFNVLQFFTNSGITQLYKITLLHFVVGSFAITKSASMIAVGGCMFIYIVLSMLIDVFDTATVAVNLDSRISMTSAAELIALTFATFNGHLVDVSFVVIYINDWLSARIVLTVIGIVCFSMTIDKCRMLWPVRARSVEYRIL